MPRRSNRNRADVSPEAGLPPEAPAGAVNNLSNKRRREDSEEHETRKREPEIQILEQKLANERAQTDALERSSAAQQQQQHQEHDDDENEGEISPEVRKIHPRFPSVKSALLHESFQDKFDPFNLYKLHRDAGLAVENDVNEEDFAISRGRLRFKKRAGTAKDLGTVKAMVQRLPSLCRDHR
jgi:hypothetical protein